jgi:hypothetical protein
MQHRVSVRPIDMAKRKHIAVCQSCGWMSRHHDSRAAAEADGDDHIITITRGEPE